MQLESLPFSLVESVQSSMLEKQRENLKTEWENIETMWETKFWQRLQACILTSLAINLVQVTVLEKIQNEDPHFRKEREKMFISKFNTKYKGMNGNNGG